MILGKILPTLSINYEGICFGDVETVFWELETYCESADSFNFLSNTFHNFKFLR